MSENKKINLSFALSLTSGLLILMNSLLFFIMQALSMFPIYQEENHHWHMMGEMMSYFWFWKWAWFFIIIGIISGIMVLASSLMLRSKPKEKLLWSTLIIVFSALSVFSMGGFFLGFIFGILSGILGILD